MALPPVLEDQIGWEASSSPPASSCMWKMVFRAALCLSEADLRDSPSFSWSAEFLYSGCCPPLCSGYSLERSRAGVVTLAVRRSIGCGVFLFLFLARLFSTARSQKAESPKPARTGQIPPCSSVVGKSTVCPEQYCWVSLILPVPRTINLPVKEPLV